MPFYYPVNSFKLWDRLIFLSISIIFLRLCYCVYMRIFILLWQQNFFSASANYKKKKKKAFLSWIALQLWKPIITSVRLQLHQRYYISLSNIFTGLFNSCIISSGWLLFSSTSLNIHISKFTEIQREGGFPFHRRCSPPGFFLSFFPEKKKKEKKASTSLSPGNQTQGIHHPSWHAVPVWLMREVVQAGDGDGALCGVPQEGSLEAAAVPRAGCSPFAQ